MLLNIIYLILCLISFAEDQPERIIKVSAKKFQYTPSVIELKKGEIVTIELTTEDRKHGFKSPELGLEGLIKPGEVTKIKFKAEKAGEFPFHCNSFCGVGHEEMTGKIVVKE